MNKRIVKRTCNVFLGWKNTPSYVVIKPEITYHVEAYNEEDHKWVTMEYFTDSRGGSIPAIFTELDVAKSFYKGEFGDVKEELICQS